MTSQGRVRALIAAAGLAVVTFLTGAGAAHAAEPVRADAGSQNAGTLSAATLTGASPNAAADRAETAAPTAGALAAPLPRPAPPAHLGAARGSIPITPDLDARLERTGSVPVGTDPVAPTSSTPIAAATSSPSHARAPPAGVLV
jgi:hypothetical protein